MLPPIAPTPKLSKKATEKFLSKVQQDLANPIGPVPTPKLADAIEKIKAEYGESPK